MRLGIILAALGGLILATALVAGFGIDEIAAALGTAGWTGLLAVCAAHLVYWAVCGCAWHALLPRTEIVSRTALVWARWIRDAGSDLLPITSVGGDLMGARAAVQRCLPAAMAIASTVADVTVELAAQLGFTLLGLAILLAWPGGHTLAPQTILFLALAAPLLAGFVVAQRVGLFLLIERGAQRLAQRWRWEGLAAAGGLQQSLRALYADRRRLLAATLLHLIGWFAAAGEAWLALALLGAQPGVLAVLAIESLAYALRSAAFVVPAALGVQEGGYVLLGPLFGVAPETMLALSLIKRARDLALGIPALVAWQLVEGGRWWRRSQ